MKRTSKIFLLLATLGLLAGCTGNKTNPSGGGGGSNVPSPDEPYLLNVIYFKSYVSPTRANEIKEGLIKATNIIDLIIWIITVITGGKGAIMMLLVSIGYLLINIYGVIKWNIEAKKDKRP